MTKKDLPPPNGGDDLEAMLRRRRADTRDEPVAPLAPVAPPAAAPKTKAQGSGMDRRSWYMARSSADALAKAVEDLHYETRKPKHVVLSELVAVALEHREDVAARLRER